MVDDGGGTPVDFFISYTQADESWAEWIRLELKQAGASTLMQTFDFMPGTSWVREIDEAVQRATRVIAVLSPAYLNSAFAAAEWQAVWPGDPGGRRRRLIPVRVAEFEVPGLLGGISYIDLVGVREGEARHRLFAGLGLPESERRRADARAGPEIRYPGSRRRPRHWYVPHHLNPNFVDRDGLVDHLHERLSSSDVVHCTVVGMGGVGKTQVAVSYALRYGEQYDAVWWISAADLSSLRRDYAALAQAVGLQEQGTDDPNELIDAVRGHIEGGRLEWLLVFDDSFDPATSLDLMPGSKVKIIVTSRNQQWRRRKELLEVDVFSEEVAKRFLLDRACEDDDDADSALELANELGRLPLALEQAGAYVAGSDLFTLAKYLEHFRRPGPVVLPEPDTPERRSVSRTFLASFEHLEETAPDAARLLCLLAFLAPDDIPIRLLLEASATVPDLLGDLPGGVLSLDKAIKCLNQYSLLRGRVGDSLGVHRLVQAVLRAHLGDARPQWAEAAVRLLAGEFPTHTWDRAAWPNCARLLPHVATATRYAQEQGAAPEATIQLLSRAGSYLRRRYDFANARDVLLRATLLAESTYQPLLSTMVETLEQLALVFSNQRNLAEARTHLERALLVGQAAWGEDDDRVGRLMERLGFEVLRPQGDLVAAKLMLERAARIYEQARPRKQLAIAYATSKLGFVLWDLQLLPEAMAAFDRARRIFEAADGYGPDHPEVARSLTGLGQVLLDLRRLEEGRRCQEQALEIFESRFGEGDLEVARTLDKLGYVVREMGEVEEARRFHTRALDIFRLVFKDDDHPEVAFVLTNLGMALGELGRVEEARSHHERALAIFDRFGDRFSVIVRGRIANLGPPSDGA